MEYREVAPRNRCLAAHFRQRHGAHVTFENHERLLQFKDGLVHVVDQIGPPSFYITLTHDSLHWPDTQRKLVVLLGLIF